MKKLKDAKVIYDKIKIPEEMERRTTDMIDNYRMSSIDAPIGSKRKSTLPGLWRTVAAAAVVLVCFTVALNANEAFAVSAKNIPVIGGIAKILTVRSYQTSENNKDISVKVPNIVVDDAQNSAPEANASSGSQAEVPALVSDVNAEIENIVNTYLADAKKRMQDDEDAFISTGGTQAEWDERDLSINVDYEVKYQQDNLLSLVLSTDESWYGAYDLKYFYNLDLSTDKRLTLQDILGEDYVTVANDSIIRQMKERTADDPDQVYWGITDGDDSSFDGFTTVDANTNFYLNQDGKPVVYFDKYEVAPGFMGAQEFVIE